MATTTTTTIQDASHALASGEPLRVLTLVGRTHGSIGSLLRGIAYAQLGDLDLATSSLEDAATKTKDALLRAKARAALAEIALTTGDPAPASRAASASAEELEALGDHRNAAMLRLVQARAEVLLGRLDEARRIVEEVLHAKSALKKAKAKRAATDARSGKIAPDLLPIALLAEAEIAIRDMKASAARNALSRARHALEDAPNHTLARALVALEQELSRPIARLVVAGVGRDADLYTIEAASSGDVLLIDACRRLVIGGHVIVPLARRAVLFSLLLELGKAWPSSVARDDLALKSFDVVRASAVNASHRSRLRVEIGRLRKLMEGLGAEPTATATGYELTTKRRDVAILLPPSDDESAHIALLLGDGASWTAQSLAEHIGISKRTVQRALTSLVENGTVIRLGTGRDLRYARPAATPIASRMVLLGLVPRVS